MAERVEPVRMPGLCQQEGTSIIPKTQVPTLIWLHQSSDYLRPALPGLTCDYKVKPRLPTAVAVNLKLQHMAQGIPTALSGYCTLQTPPTERLCKTPGSPYTLTFLV